MAFDIDIDFADRDKALTGLTHIPACIVRNDGDAEKHPVGIYLQDIPSDPITGLATIDHKVASEKGYFKFDLLNVTHYSGIRDEDHLLRLLHTEPVWEFFDDPDIVSQLSHIHGYFGVVQSIQPRSIEDLAVVLALIRPAAKHLRYAPRQIIDTKIWKLSPDEGFAFKKAHAIAYAAAIVVQLNLLCEQTMAELSEKSESLE